MSDAFNIPAWVNGNISVTCVWNTGAIQTIGP